MMSAYEYERALSWAVALGAPLLSQNGVQSPYTPAACRAADFDPAYMLRKLWNITDAQGIRELARQMWDGMHNPSFQQDRLMLAGMTLDQRQDYVQSCRGKERYEQLYLVNLYMDRLPAAGIAAWDLGRLVFYVRCARLANYIHEEEEEALLLHTAIRARLSYRSWPEYAVAYMAGRQFWAGDLSEEGAELNYEILRRLLTEEQALWRELEWDMDLPEPPELED